MKQLRFRVFVLAALMSAAPCAAQTAALQIEDAAGARSALSSAAAKDRLAAIRYLAVGRYYEVLAGHFAVEKDAHLRVQLVQGLDVQGSTWAYQCAAAAAGDANKSVRQAAAAALAFMAGDPAADVKLSALAADPVEKVRMALVNSLALNASTAAVSIIGAALSDANAPQRVRRAAAGALAGMKTPEADKELLKHGTDPDPEVKAAAASRKPAKAKVGEKSNAIPAGR